MKSKFKKYLLLIFVFLIFCNRSEIYNNYNFIVSLDKNEFVYILKSNKYSYKGDNFNKLQERLKIRLLKYEECIKNGGTNEKCNSFITDKFLFEFDENSTIKDLLVLKPTFRYFDGNPGYDLKINDKILHFYAVTDIRGDQTLLNVKKVSNEFDKYLNQKINIICDENRVVFDYRDDTLFKGNYNELMEKFSKEQINLIRVGYKNWRLPDILLNTTCDLSFKRLYQISNCFTDCSQLLFQIGEHFDCSDSTIEK